MTPPIHDQDAVELGAVIRLAVESIGVACLAAMLAVVRLVRGGRRGD